MKAQQTMTGDQLKTLMDGVGLSTAALARAAGVTPQYISQLRGAGELSEAAVQLVWPVIESRAREVQKTVAGILEAS